MRFFKRLLKRIQSTGGMFSLVELLIAAIITVIMTIAVAATMLGTARAYIAVADQSLTQGNSKWAMDRIKEEVMQAYPLFFQSDDDNILFTKHGVDLDALDPANGGEDTVCYRHTPPTPSVADCQRDDYQPGAIWRGVNTGGSVGGGNAVCSWPDDYRRITDNLTDIRSLKFEYCYPDGTNVGEYTCDSTNLDDLDLDGDSNPDCVWQVVISMTVARRLRSAGSGIPGPDCNRVANEMKSTVRPRVIYMRCFDIDLDSGNPDGIPDGLKDTWAESI